MSKAVALKEADTSIANAEQVGNYFEQYAEAASRSKLVGDLIKFSKGDYFYGQDEKELKAGARLIANMNELLIGWVKWENSKPADSVMGKLTDGYIPPKRSELGDTDKTVWEFDDKGQPKDPWQLTNYLILAGEPGSDREGQLFTFATSSKGGLGAIGKLCGAYGKAMRQNPGKLPVIAMEVGKYKHSNPEYGWIKYPEFKVVDWAAASVLTELMAQAAADDEAQAAADEEVRTGKTKF